MINKDLEIKRQLVCLCEWIINATDEDVEQYEQADAICIKLFIDAPLTKRDRAFLKRFYGTYEFITRGRWEDYLLIDYLDSLDSIDIWTSLDECIDLDECIEDEPKIPYERVYELLGNALEYLDEYSNACEDYKNTLADGIGITPKEFARFYDDSYAIRIFYECDGNDGYCDCCPSANECETYKEYYGIEDKKDNDNDTKEDNSKDKEIIIDIYGKTEIWTDRNQAINYYMESALCTDGAEQSRYMYVVTQLKNGATYIYSNMY